MKLKCHLQYERDFCNLMASRGYHTERIASSGRRKKSVCDAVMFSKNESFLVEIKSTSKNVMRLDKLHGIIEKANEFNITPLLVVYFKSKHSSEGKGKWIMKRLNGITKVLKNDQSDIV